jgi:ribokinase
MKPPIVVVGSSNTDMVIRTEHIPAPGETILGGTFFMNPGGKGANQAVAAARLGAHVVFICKTGNDIFGKQALDGFAKEHIDTNFIRRDADNPSGVALITVDKKGQNSIAVAAGANANLLKQDIEKAIPVIENAAYVLLQLEIPLDIVKYVASIAFAKKVKVILNPAPACELPEGLLEQVSIITPNETEAQMLTGISVIDSKSAEQAARKLAATGIKTVIITRGEAGAFLLHEGEVSDIPVMPVRAVDTTAAGDVFNGALVVALSNGLSMKDAVTFANRAAAISVTRLGAQSSAPYLNEVTKSF